MHLRPVVHALGVVFVLCASPVAAQRQAPPAPDDWRHGTTLTLSSGMALDESSSRAAAGGAIGWELTPRLTVEGAGLWIDSNGGTDRFNAAVKVRTSVGHATMTPFVEGGIGLYHVIANGPASLPDFYRRRMSASGSRRESFTDPTFQIGGGASWFASRHIALQPAIEAVIVTRNSHAYTMATVSLRVSYHFENHPVTR